MNAFDSHVENIAKAISVDLNTLNHLAKDFTLLRAYITDILRRDAVLGPKIIESDATDNNFNCSLTFDFSRNIHLNVFQSAYPSFIKLGQHKNHHNQGLPFITKDHNMAGGLVTNVVRSLIEHGLASSGCFVRGHKGDIYELEVCDTTIKEAKYNPRINDSRDWVGEWQTNYIMLQATTDGYTIKIRLRVLIKFCTDDKPRNFIPHPTHRLKMDLLGAADVRYLEYFSLCTPLSERELAAVPEYLIAMRLLSALFARINLSSLKKIHLQSVTFELIYTRGPTHARETIADIILVILRRMLKYLFGKSFPYYWDIKRDLLIYFQQHCSIICTRNTLERFLINLRNMRHNKEITYEEVESFFGIQINTEIYNVDDFGIYRSFAECS